MYICIYLYLLMMFYMLVYVLLSMFYMFGYVLVFEEWVIIKSEIIIDFMELSFDRWDRRYKYR